MAQAIVYRCCTKLRSAIRDEATIRWKFSGDLEEMMTALEEIQPDLDEAERRSLWEVAVRDWLMLVRKAGYDIWDMVDELQDTSPAARTMTWIPCRLSVVPKKENSMPIKMKHLKEQLKTLQEEALRFGFTRLDANVQQAINVVGDKAPEIDEAKVVGRDRDKERMMSLLPETERDFREGPIILPIYGPQGIGKTTLAAMIFNDTRFRGYSRVWIHVSQKFDLHQIGNSIISQVSEQINHDSNDMEYIAERLHELLSAAKVLIVLHDLWEEDAIGLQSLKRMLSVADKGSQVIVIVTACKVAIALDICTTRPYRLDRLSDDICWRILKQSSYFEDRSESNKQVLEKIGRQIASMCDGLPLAAKEIGRMLQFQDDRRWAEVSMLLNEHAERWDLNSDSFYSTDSCPSPSPLELLDSTLPVEISDSPSSAKFSYNCSFLPFKFRYISMPPNMRLCFAYLAMFSDDPLIVKDDLIHQWIALDLIEPSDRFSSKQLGEQYFRTLIGMSFLGAAELDSDGGEDGKDGSMFYWQFPANNFASYIMGDEFTFLDDRIRMDVSHQKEHCRYAMASHFGDKLQLILPTQLRALRCSNRDLNDVSFSFASCCLRVLELKETYIQKLPDSICQLRQLRYLNLSGCYRLVTLLETFGDLINLMHIDLSGCSGLVKLPQSLGKLINLVHMDISRCSRLVKLPPSLGRLINLVHINFSDCSGLVNLPESFGDLINLLHVDLSGCSQLENILELFENLKKVVYLDLSFWSCLKGIPVLGGLTNLQHLNLSHPCCYLAEHTSHLEGLPGVLGKLTELQYLNLSMLLNPIFYYKSENQRREYIQSCLNGLHNLKHLDLSHNIFLSEIPESIGYLKKLHTLDLLGCARLKIAAKWMDESKSMKLIVGRSCPGPQSYQFVVTSRDGAYGSSNLVELGGVDCEYLEISCLEKVKSKVEAQRIRLADKQRLRKLKLCWTVGAQGSVKDSALLGELVPPHNLQCLKIHGYNSKTCHPAWMLSVSSALTNLAEVTMEDFPRCSRLPPLGLLPNLQRLVLRKMTSITRIDARDFFDGNISQVSQLSKVTLDGMERLEEFMFPAIDELVIHKCPELSFGPIPPRARKLLISDCDQVMSSSGNKEGYGVEGPSTPVTELVVERCMVPLSDWSLLHNLPGLRSLTIKSCYDLTSSLEGMKVLSSIEKLCFSHCDGMRLLPGYLGELKSLQQLKIESCKQLYYMPSIHKLTNLKLKDVHISDCPKLEKWCELEENNEKFAHFLRKPEVPRPLPQDNWIMETPFNGEYPWSSGSSENDFKHTRYEDEASTS
ncbi:hypothetical protein ACQ4PT_007697 [Festuca glaucescens]